MAHQLDLLVADILNPGDSELETSRMPADRAHRRREVRRRMIRQGQEDALTDVLDAPPEQGESVHVVSAAKYDFWTWVPCLLDWIGRADSCYCSTWTLCRNNAVELFEECDNGRIDPRRLGVLTGTYFKRRETAVYAYLLDGLQKRGGRYRAFSNHAKVLLLENADGGHYLTVEGSANLTSNPRLEQYVLTADKALWEFHRKWFEEMLLSPRLASDEPTKATAPRRGYSQRRAGLGVLSVYLDKRARSHIIRWKTATGEDPVVTATFADDLATLARQAHPVMTGWAVTCPPQGASLPGHYYAASLAKAVAAKLGLPYLELLERSDSKKYHGPHASLEQTPYKLRPPASTPAAALVVDDLITSGTTCKLSLAALRDAGIPAYGLAYSGC